jgi:hypothetical protein
MKSGALVLEELIPTLQQTGLIVANDMKYVTELLPSKSAGARKRHRVKPDLRKGRSPPDVHVRRFSRINAVDEKDERSGAQEHRHTP